jgi:hypothetical protein
MTTMNMTIPTTAQDLIVTPESVATAGLISYWRLSGTVDLFRLAGAWRSAGLDPQLLPTSCSPVTALGRAVHDQAAKRVLIRPMAKHGMWAIVEEAVIRHEDGRPDELEYNTIMRVTHVPGGTPNFDSTLGHREASALSTMILNAYGQHQTTFACEDISAWLIKLAGLNKAVTLRDTGGIYFVPRPAADFWRRVVQVVQAVSSHRVFLIPAMKNSEAIDAITEAVTREAELAVAAIEAELEKSGDDRLGPKALATRADTCRELLAKVTSYEHLLGVQLKVVAQVEGLQGSIAAAALLRGQD